HNLGMGIGDRWLKGFLPSTLTSLPSNTLVLIMFDEPGTTSPVTTPIYTIAIGTKVRAGVDGASYNHYSFLKTVEENWGLGSLGRADVDAVPLAGLA
ncbi:hypothetical protein HDU93_004274, partial [Gonapodya sp. JEL0774]